MDEERVVERIDEGLGKVEEQVGKAVHDHHMEKHGVAREVGTQAKEAREAVSERAKEALDDIERP